MIKLRFKITEVHPDQRAYRQNEFVLVPLNDLLLEIEVNDENVVQEVETGEVPTVLNLAALKELADKFDTVFYGVAEDDDDEYDDYE